MNKAKDFSEDLADVSNKVSNDVDAILKIVRQTDGSGDNSAHHSSKAENHTATSADAKTSPSLKPNKPRNARTRLNSGSRLADEVVRENVTTRLRRNTNELLTEAALRQKLKKEEPSTRQDIIEVALQDWFRRQGYAISKE